MALVKMELPLSSVDVTYCDSFTILAIGRARRLGFTNAAALFSEAYKNYDKKMPSDVLGLVRIQRACAAFLKKYKIQYKEDIVYLVRHPEHQKRAKLEEINTRRKIIIFDTESSDPAEQAALKYLKSLKRRERASVVYKILDQYFIMCNNKLYFEEKAGRLFNYLRANADLSSDHLPKDIEKIIDLIWILGRYASDNK